MGSPRPPRVSRRLLFLLLPERYRDEVLRALDERFTARIGRGESVSAARRWYREQVLRSLVPAVRVHLGRRKPEPIAQGKRMGGAADGGPEPSGDARRSEGGGWTRTEWESLAQDLRFAVVQLRRSPGFTLVVVFTLALGIGATTSVFTLVDAALLKPFSYRDPDQLVVIRADRTRSEIRAPFMSGPDVMDIRREARSFSGVACLDEPLVAPLTQVDRPEHVKNAWTSPDFFQVLGVEAAVGRTYGPELVSAVAADSALYGVAMLSYGLWQRAFGGDSAVVGRTVHTWGRPVLVSGVLPEDFTLRMPLDLFPGGDIEVYGTDADFFLDEEPDRWWMRVVARLHDGVAPSAANAELDALARQLESVRAANAQQGTRFRVEFLTGSVLGPIRDTLDAFVVAVGLLLLIACANVANLLLVRGTIRVPELAVRSALGAGRRRIVRQLLTECAVLSVLGTGLGVALAFAAVGLLAAIAPAAEVLPIGEANLDGHLVAFAAVTAVATTFIAGLAPALRVTGRGLSGRFELRGGIGGHHRFAGSLAVVQVALSVSLLAGVGLMIRTVTELQRVPLGFEPTGVLTANVTQVARRREERAEVEAALLREVSSLPGVHGAGIVFPLPMNGVYERTVRYASVLQEADHRAWRDAYFRSISPGYLEAADIALTAGRGFREEDENLEHPVAIVDEVIARRTWPGEDPLGRLVRAVGMGTDRDSLRFEIVGVAEYAPQWDHRDVRPTIYFPRTIYRSMEVSLALRVAGDPLSLAGPLRSAVRRVEPGLPVDVVPLERYVSDTMSPTRFVLVLLGVFGAAAVGLTGVGLYGVLAHGVRQRTREIGVRMALGARASTILVEVARRGGRVALIGAGLGLGGALALGRLLRSHLYQVEMTDPSALLGSAVAVILVAAVASWLPARGAAKVDPVEALSAE